MTDAKTPLLTRDLAFRLEAAEAACLKAKLLALMEDEGSAHGVETARFGRTILLSVQSRRHNPSYNRVMCFAQEDEGHLDGILQWMRDKDVRFWFDVVPALVDAAPDAGEGSMLHRLDDAGLVPACFMNVVYTVPRAPKHHSSPDLVVEEIDLRDPGRLHGFAVALSDGFGVPRDVIESTQKAAQIEYAAPGWHVYLVSIEGCPAGVATLYADGTVASIDAMATVPRYRRHGFQTALLQRCIADAARTGCELLASQTQSGSTSERNMSRAGFRVAYTKVLYSERSGETG